MNQTAISQGSSQMNVTVGGKTNLNKPPPPLDAKGASRLKLGKSAHMQAMEKKEEELEVDANEARVEKLLNSKVSDRNKVVFSFSFVTLVILVPFVIMLILYTMYMETLKFNYEHYGYISSLPAEMKYTLAFAQECVAKNEIIQIKSPGDEQVEGYKHYDVITYETLASMEQDFKKKFDGAFGGYIDDYETYYYTSLCNLTDSSVSLGIECGSNPNKTILNKGAKTSIYGLLSDASQIMIEFNNSGNPISLNKRKNIIDGKVPDNL